MVAKATQLPRNWSALYQQRPAPETGDYFKQDWFRTHTSDPPRETLNVYGASDYAVCATGSPARTRAALFGHKRPMIGHQMCRGKVTLKPPNLS